VARFAATVTKARADNMVPLFIVISVDAAPKASSTREP
jgi:hypothetical protein